MLQKRIPEMWWVLLNHKRRLNAIIFYYLVNERMKYLTEKCELPTFSLVHHSNSTLLSVLLKWDQWITT